jgi:hypothetical protein
LQGFDVLVGWVPLARTATFTLVAVALGSVLCRAGWVAVRDAAGGGLAVAARPGPASGAFSEKVEELVQRSRGKIRADKAHKTLVLMGYEGSERTTRRTVAQAKRRWRPSRGMRARRGRGSPSRGCGCSGITATGPRSRGARRCCSARGWRGRVFGSCWRCAIRRSRAW